MINFNDKKNRKIILSSSFEAGEVIAKYGNKEIGIFEFSFIEDDYIEYDYELTNMNIDSAFCRVGIGEEMMKLAVDTFGTFALPKSWDGEKKFNDDNYLTQEGANFINKCFQKGILNDDFRSL